jgi:arylsulfatase A-like enzyme
MSATITLSTDEDGIVAQRTVRPLFPAGGQKRPVTAVEFRLDAWDGKLVCIEVKGTVCRRSLEEGATGHVACALELVGEGGSQPLEFLSWQEGSNIGLHIGPVGPYARDVGAEGGHRFAIASKETLWHVLRASAETRLRAVVKPVLSVDLPGGPRPFLPSRLQVDRPRRRWPVVPPERRPDIFIYLIDALRPDHLGCYGYDRATSPMMDAFAAEATVYEEAHTPSTWTRPSVATILTGLYPSVHRAMHKSDLLEDWPVLLPEILHEAGYGTLCVTTNHQVSQHAGFDQGYDRFIFTEPFTGKWASKVAGDLLANWDTGQPVFVYVHAMKPHEPYTPGPEHRQLFDRGFPDRWGDEPATLRDISPIRPGLSAEDFQHLIDLYDAEVLEADEGFAAFLEMVHSLRRFDDALLILVSDHGESFGEHNTCSHGYTLSRQEMQVVLIVRYPQGRLVGVRVPDRVSMLDVLPTVLAAAGLSPDLDYDLVGTDLAHIAQGAVEDSPRHVFGETAFWDSHDLDLVGVLDEDGYKRVLDVSVLPRENAAEGSVGLWDTHTDPDELHDLCESMPVRTKYCDQLIAQWLHRQSEWRSGLRPGPPPRVEMTPELRRKLLHLGYLRGPPPADQSAH